MISVDLAKYPQHAAQLRRHAARMVHAGRTAQLPRRVWQAIRDGRPVPHVQTPYMGDPRPDPIRNQPCCAPPSSEVR